MNHIENEIMKIMGLALIKAFNDDKRRKLEKWNKYRKNN